MAELDVKGQSAKAELGAQRSWMCLAGRLWLNHFL